MVNPHTSRVFTLAYINDIGSNQNIFAGAAADWVGTGHTVRVIRMRVEMCMLPTLPKLGTELGCGLFEACA
jgi:hypothetical protein